jgi:hypothetical protein
MNRSVIVIIVMVLALLGLILFSCSGSGGNSGFLPLTGKIALYLTDDLSMYSQVTATVNRVQLKHTGLGASCDVMTEPVTINFAGLFPIEVGREGDLQFVNEAECPAGPYNRIHIEFDRNVQLMSGPTGSQNMCVFESYKNDDGSQVNVLQCDQNGTCSLDVNGAVNVAALKGEKMGLDFDLKNFEVNFLTDPCAVTMKVSPLTPGQMRGHERMEVITGLVSGLSTTDRTFDLTRGSRTFSVVYSAVTNSLQPGIDELLVKAQDVRLRTKVYTTGIDLANNRIDATAIRVKVEGTVSELVTNSSFTVLYDTQAIPVAEIGGRVEGILADGVWVDVKLLGFSALNNNFIADKVEVEIPGTMTED